MRGRSLLWPLVLLILGVPETFARPPGPSDELTATQEKLARLYEERDDPREALRIWRELLAVAPDEPRYLREVVRLSLELERPADALEPARRLVRLQPQSAPHRSQLVAVLAALHREVEALPHLEFLKQRAPGDAEVRKELCDAYQALRRPTQALEQIDWLVQRFPGNLEYRRTRADLLGELNRDAERLAELRRLLPRLPPREQAAVHREQAQGFIDEERYAEAESELRAALAVHPSDVKSRGLLRQLTGWRDQLRLRRERARRDAEQWSEWLQDVQEHAEDF